MAHASEAGHWYSKAGESVYEVPAVKGGMRPATLRDARKLSLVPGVTTIIRCAAAPGLERWKVQQGILAALTMPRRPEEPEGEYLARILSDSQEQARRAAERGTAIHAAIQGHYEGYPPAEEHWPFVKAAMTAIRDHCNDWEWIAEASFSHPLGFGGKVDLHNSGWVIDVKSKEFGPDDGKQLAWDEHCLQLAAYREGLGYPQARCANVFVSVTHPGLAIVHPWDEEELQRGWKMFQALLLYWQIKNRYVPSVGTG
jgi:hypothetical protein